MAYLQERSIAFLLRNLAGAVKHIGVGSLRALGHEPGLDDIQRSRHHASNGACQRPCMHQTSHQRSIEVYAYTHTHIWFELTSCHVWAFALNGLEDMREGQSEGRLQGRSEGRWEGGSEGTLRRQVSKARRQICFQARGQVRGRVRGRVRGQVRGQVRGHVRGRVRGQVSWQIQQDRSGDRARGQVSMLPLKLHPMPEDLSYSPKKCDVVPRDTSPEGPCC